MKFELHKRKNCRLCGGGVLKILSWEQMPLAAQVTSKKNSSLELYPLEVYLCENCGHVQLMDVIDVSIYDNYLYTPSFSSAYSEYLDHFSKRITQTYGKCRVVEVGSSDGLLLYKLKQEGCNVLGFEPSKCLADRAWKKYKVVTANSYFGNDAKTEAIIQNHFKDKTDLIIIRHVLEHLDDLDSILEAFKHNLSDSGSIVIEVPFLKNIIEENQFYAFFHEHLSYFSFKALKNLLRAHNFYIADAMTAKVEGGSIIIFASKEYREATEAANLLYEQEQLTVSIETIKQFAQATQQYVTDIKMFISQCKTNNKKLAGWGAGQRAVTLLNACELTGEDLEFVIDVNENYQGNYLPGTGIPIVAPTILKDKKIDGIIVFATGYLESIMDMSHEFLSGGGRFIQLIPEIRWI